MAENLCEAHLECARLSASLELLDAVSKLTRSVSEGDSTGDFPTPSLTLRVSQPVLKQPSVGLIGSESITRFRSMADLLQERLREFTDLVLVQTQLRSRVDQQVDLPETTAWQSVLSQAQTELEQCGQSFWNWATPQTLQELRDVAETALRDSASLIVETLHIPNQTAVERKLQHYEVELQLLRRLGVICSEASSEDELLQRATTLIADTLFPDNCGFLLLYSARGVLVTHPSFVLSDPNVSRSDKALGVGITGQVAQTGIARRVGDVSLEPGYLAADSRTRSELCLPMKINSIVVGVLNVESDQQNAFSDNDERLAGTVVDLVCNALERLRLEQAARQSEQHFALFMQHLPGLAWIKDDRGRYVFANAGAEKAFGISLSQLAGKTDDEVFPAETAAQFKENDSLALKSATEIRTIEQLKHKDDIVHQSIVSKFSLPHSNGTSLFVGGVAFDITEHKQAEETLRKVSAFRETIVRTAAEGICVCHAISEFPYVTFLVWNERMTELTGYTIEEISRLGWYQAMYPDPELQQRAIHRMSEMRVGNDMRAEEWEITRKDGVRRTVAISTSIVEMEENSVCVMAVMHDVTERKRGDEILRVSESRYRLTAELASSFSYQATIAADYQVTFQWVGGHFEDVTGYRPEDLNGQNWFALIPIEDQSRILEQVAGLNSPETDLSNPLEVRIQTRAGEERWLRSVVHVELPSKPGEAITIFGAALDITEQKQSERTLQMMQFSVDISSDAIFWVAPDARILYANEAASQRLGYSIDELLQKSVFDFDPDFPAVAWPDHWAELKQRRSMVFESRNQAKDGQIIEVEINANYVNFDGQEFNFASSRDITVRKRQEALLRGQNQVLEMIAANSPLEDTLTALLRQIEAQSPEMLCSILLLNDAGTHLYHGAAPSLPDEYTRAIDGVPIGPTEGSCGTAAFRREPVIVEDIEHDPLWANYRETALPHRLHACWSVPIIDGQNQVLGTFAIYYQHPCLPIDRHWELIAFATRSAAIAITQRREQVALREIEERFKSFMDQRPVVAWIKDDEFRFRYANLALGQLFQSSVSEVLGRTDYDLYNKESADITRANDRLVLESGKILEAIEQVPGADGRMRSWLVQKFPLHRTGKQTWTGGTAVDVTARREAEEAEDALRQSKSRFRQLVEASPNAIVMAAADGNIVFTNLKTQQLLGYTADEMKGQPVELLLPERFRANHPTLRSAFLANPSTRQMGAERELFARHKNGQEVSVEIGLTPIERSDGLFILATVTDITHRKRTETALRENEERFRLLFEGANDAIFWANASTGVLTNCNPAAESLLGRDRSEIIGQPQSTLHPPEELERYGAMFRQHASSKSKEPFELEVVRKDGRRVAVSISPSVTVISGQPIIQGIFRDISERKRSEETIQRVLDAIAPTTGQAFFSTLVKFLCDVCHVKYVVAGAISPSDAHEIQTIAVSHRGEPVNNFSYDTRNTPCEQVIGRSICFVPINVQQEFPKDQMLEEMGIDSYLGIPLWSSEGKPLGLIVLLNDRPFLEPEQTQVILKVVAARCGVELERQRGEKLRQQSEERLLAVVRHAPNVAIQWYDLEGRVKLWNEASEAMFGFTAAEAAGKTLDQLIQTPEEHAIFIETLASIIRTKMTVGPIKYTFHRSNGELGTCLSNIFMIPGDDQSNWFVRMDVDVTEQKRIEAEMSLRQRDLLHASRLNAIGQMVAGLSHEVAQPLNAISNFATASHRLLESDTSEKLETLKEYVQAIVDQSRRSAAILRRLRDFSRRTPTQKDQCDLNQILLESFELVSPELRRNNTRVRLELSTTLPFMLADRIQIQQVVINLLTNAMDALGNQSPERRQITIRSRDEVEFVVFEVEDSGPGIPPEVAQRLFEPFFTTKSEGMGIGLNICETIVRDHGGKIAAVSNKLSGATFRIQLPFQLNEDVTS